MRYANALSVVFGLVIPAVASAQESNRRIGLDIVFTSLDEVQARKDSIKASGWGYQISIAGKRAWFLGGAGFGQYLHKDLNEFTVSTTGGDRKSGADIWNLSVWGGLEAPGLKTSSTSNSRLTVSAVGGYTQVFMAAVREGIDCVDCPERKLGVKGGMFVEPSLKLLTGKVELAVLQRTYFGGHLKTVTGFRIAYTGRD